MRIAYICDGFVKDCSKTECYLSRAHGECKRTTDRDHAVNGAVIFPDKERFEEVSEGVWVEREHINRV